MPISLHLIFGRYEVAFAAERSGNDFDESMTSAVAETERLIFGFVAEDEELDEE